jgi:hypothetical protein
MSLCADYLEEKLQVEGSESESHTYRISAFSAFSDIVY